MPIIYLSPSTQEGNLYITGGTEEQYMNLVADAMEPILRSSGIQFQRNTPEMTAASSIRQANAGNFDFYLALHSNAAPDALSGQLRGTDVYYAPNSIWGQRMANIIVSNFKVIYPLPNRVRALSTTSIGEVVKTRAPAVLVEIAYHDNVNDAKWITGNIQAIARSLVLSLCEYFGIPFISAQLPRQGTVSLTSGSLNLRSRPSSSCAIITRIPNGAQVTVWGQWQNWYVIEYNGSVGYVSAQYIYV